MVISRMVAGERRSFEARRREPDWPLPSRGWAEAAAEHEVDARFAAKLQNLWWSGGRLMQRPGYTLSNPSIARQRVTHALTGGAPQAITIFPSYIQAAASAIARTTAGRMMAASLSNNTILADGAGPIVRFDGTTLDLPLFTGDGLDPATLDGVIAHHDRLYLWRSGGPLEFWYGGLGAVQGALTKFPLGRLGNIEGGIAAMGRYTSDAGDNVNDLLVVMTTAGDVVIYEGIDPGLSDSWRLWGRLKLAAPVSRYAMLNYGPDLLVLTVEGIASIGQSMGRGAPSLSDAMSGAIADTMQVAIAAAPTSGRWQMIADPGQKYVIVNTPQDRAFVFNVESRGWSEWTELPVLNWRRRGSDILFTGTDGREMLFGGDDDAGSAIRSTWWSPWLRNIGPHIATIRPFIRSAGDLTLNVAVLIDQQDTAADLVEAAQTVTIPAQRPDDASAQAHGEPVMVGMTGEAFQLRLSFDGRGGRIVAVRWTR